MEEGKLAQLETRGRGQKTNKKYIKYCYRECNSTLSIDAKKSREMIRVGGTNKFLTRELRIKMTSTQKGMACCDTYHYFFCIH